VSFVPDDFDVPTELRTPSFVLRPLGPQHNEQDYAAWSSSIEHIRSTPGFPDGNWPRPMTLEENERDLRRHADHFAARKGFTYTVLSPDEDDVIGCVYIYPGAEDAAAIVQSWVRESHAHLDAELYRAVTRWLDEHWPFDSVDYGAR
jgi:RimJ/RimL family protein N-acetyltransferase